MSSWCRHCPHTGAGQVDGRTRGHPRRRADQKGRKYHDRPDDAQTGAERRISGFDEVVDGGYGIGSARPIDDGAQPLAHPVKAWTDRKSFVAPGDEGFDGADRDVWF